MDPECPCVMFFVQGSHASWKVLKSTEFLGQISRQWKVLENDFGP